MTFDSRLKRALLAVLVASVYGVFGCAAGPSATGDVSHGDYGYCDRSVRHKHNDHVFLGSYHDHSLCEWEKFN